MKRIIGGVAYDTETSDLVFQGSYDEGQPSQAWWSLYQNRSGAFFEVAAGHDGVVESWLPLSHREAREWLERHANHLVEMYFGPMPEAEPSKADRRFSRRTVIAAIDVMEGAGLSTAELTRIFLRWGPEVASRCDSGSEPHRYNHLIKFFDEKPDRAVSDGEPLATAIVTTAVSLLPKAESRAEFFGDGDVTLGQKFRRAIEIDGFAISEGALRRTLPAELGIPQAQDDVSRLLKKHGFDVLKGHLEQALDAHARGEWASANAQLRTFYEGMFDEIAIRIDPSAAQLPSSENRRARLAQVDFLDEGLNEWSSDGKNFINGLFKRLHPSGSHPGLSDQDDSTFRRHVVLITAQLMLVRFDNWPP